MYMGTPFVLSPLIRIAQKNLHKVTAPGKLIYVDDGEDALCSQDRTNV